MDFTSVSDEALLAGLSTMMAAERKLGARVVSYLLEVQDRRLDLKAASSSLFDFCTRRLGMSEGEAFRRINAARLVRKFPRLLAFLERGEIHLSALVLLRDHLTDDNWEELVRAASRKSKREIEELLAARFPKPDAPTMFRLLPSTVASAGSVGEAASGTSPPPPARGGRRFASSGSQGRIEPLSSERYKLQITTSRELYDKIERARRLMRHRNPVGDLAVVLEKGIDLLIAKLEKERLGKSTRPRKGRKAKHGYVTRAARRDVFARDGEQCSYVGSDGERCTARAFLEVDHVRARARGGCGKAANLRILCHAHNLLLAEEEFGQQHVENAIARSRQKSAAPNAPGDEHAFSDGVEQHPHASGAHDPEEPTSLRRSPPTDPDSVGSVDDDAVPVQHERAQEGSSGDADPRHPRHPSSCSGRAPAARDSASCAGESSGRGAGVERWAPRLDQATEGLVSMGFRVKEARSAIELVHNRRKAAQGEAPPVEQLLREALAILC